jgi:drug/metabolite transporter (DMT)-like permease
MRLSKQHFAIFALIIANVIWGAAAPIFKWSLQNIDPFTLGFFRFAFAALLLLPFTIRNLKIKQHDIPTLIILSLLGITAHIALFFIGLQYSSSINAPVIGSAAPIFILLGSVLFLKERLKMKAGIGMLVSLLGVLVIILPPALSSGFDKSFLGNFFFVLATILAAVHVLLLKEIADKYSAYTVTFWSFAIAATGFLPLMIGEVQQNGLLTDVGYQGLIGIYFGAVLSSAVAYILYNYAVKNMVTNEVGIFTYLDPVFAVVIAVPLLGETITSTFVLGTMLVFVGLYIAEGRIPWHPLHKLKRIS